MRRLTKTILILSWLALVVPLVPLGYGSDGDAWLVVQATEKIWTTGRYVASRSSGFPLFEILVTPLVHFGGWTLSNTVALLAGLSMLFALFRLSDTGTFRRPVLSVVCLAFLPIIIKSSSSTMDFVPATALLLWAYLDLTAHKYARSSVLTGIACGFRPTSGLFIIPSVVYALRSKEGWGMAGRQLLLAVSSGLVAYSPVLVTYGYRRPYPSFPIDAGTMLLIGGYNLLQVLGIPQTVLVASVVGRGLVAAWRSGCDALRSPEFLFHATNLGTWIALFAVLPNKAEYLMPAVVSVVWFLDRFVGPRTFAATAAALLAYHVVSIDALGGESGQRYVKWSVRPGFTIAEIQNRIFMLSTRDAAARYHPEMPTVLMFGYPWVTTDTDAWVYLEDLQMYRQRDGNLYITGCILDESRLRHLSQMGFRLLVWRGEKWEYLRSPGLHWAEYVQVVDDLGEFFHQPIHGTAFTER